MSKSDEEQDLVYVDVGPVEKWLSTGCTLLDLAIADRLPVGFPVGRVSHVYGKESTAKSVLAQEPLGSVQRQGGKAFFADAEFTLDTGRAQSIFGIDTTDEEKWHYSTPSSVEILFDTDIAGALASIEEEEIELAAMSIDSLSSLPSETEKNEELDKAGYGTIRARQLSRAFRKFLWL